MPKNISISIWTQSVVTQQHPTLQFTNAAAYVEWFIYRAGTIGKGNIVCFYSFLRLSMTRIGATVNRPLYNI